MRISVEVDVKNYKLKKKMFLLNLILMLLICTMLIFFTVFFKSPSSRFNFFAEAVIRVLNGVSNSGGSEQSHWEKNITLN